MSWQYRASDDLVVGYVHLRKGDTVIGGRLGDGIGAVESHFCGHIVVDHGVQLVAKGAGNEV